MYGGEKGGKGGGAKGGKGAKGDAPVPAHAEVCEPCLAHIQNNEEIPPHLLAKLIKFKLLDIKTRDRHRRDVEKKVRSPLTLDQKELIRNSPVTTYTCTCNSCYL